jgi:hypothetical protein
MTRRSADPGPDDQPARGSGGAVARHRPAVRNGRAGISPLLSKHPRVIAV